MNQKKIIVIGVVVLVVLALFMFNVPGNQSVSPNILYLTQPVTFFSGKVERVEGNAVLVSSQYSLPQTAPIVITVLPGQPPIMPTPQIKIITYRLLVTDKTQINQPTPVNYLLKTVTPASVAKLTVKDVKVGQMITVNSAVDLRTLKNNEFEATMINLPQIINTLTGKITSVTNNTLTLKAFAPVAAGGPMGPATGAPQEKEFTITVNQDTEISRMSFSAPAAPGEAPTPPKSEKLALSDLKVDMQAIVYTAEDVTESQLLTALRVELAQVIVAPTSPALSPSPVPSASVSPSIKP